MKGTRRLQLRNSMQAKFDKILLPIGELVLAPEDHEHLKFDAFFWNVTFHEVAHGLGIKETINGKGSVDAAMGTEKTSWEEAKADILGLFMVCNLIEKGEISLLPQCRRSLRNRLREVQGSHQRMGRPDPDHPGQRRRDIRHRVP